MAKDQVDVLAREITREFVRRRQLGSEASLEIIWEETQKRLKRGERPRVAASEPLSFVGLDPTVEVLVVVIIPLVLNVVGGLMTREIWDGMKRNRQSISKSVSELLEKSAEGSKLTKRDRKALQQAILNQLQSLMDKDGA